VQTRFESAGKRARGFSDLSDFEVFDVNTIVTDSKGPPDRKNDTLSQTSYFLSDSRARLAVRIGSDCPYEFSMDLA
jgi:hypothetical protein